MKDTPDRRELLRFALGLMDSARRTVLKKIASGFTVRAKSDKSFVTDADTSVERVLRRAIMKSFPEHGIIGEEYPALNASSDFQWIIDPIDGTLSFTRGIPLYGCILSLHRGGKPLLGVIDHPGLGSRVYAAAGLGCYADGKRVRLNNLDSRQPVEGELIASGDRSQFIRTGDEKLFDRLLRRHPQVRIYADCFGHTLAVRGSVGAMVDYGVKIWDISATQLLVEEAGGKFLIVKKQDKPGGTLYSVVFGKPKVVDWIQKFVIIYGVRSSLYTFSERV